MLRLLQLIASEYGLAIERGNGNSESNYGGFMITLNGSTLCGLRFNIPEDQILQCLLYQLDFLRDQAENTKAA